MKKKQVFRLLEHAFLCLLASAVFWSWIFTFLTDAARENKIVIYANMRDFRWKDLAVSLEESSPENIRFVQVHPFTYALMDSSDLEQADLYVMTEAQAREFARFIVPLPDSLPEALSALARFIVPLPDSLPDALSAGSDSALQALSAGSDSVLQALSAGSDSALQGLLLYDAETGSGVAMEDLNYADQPGQNWYLFFGSGASRHSDPEKTPESTVLRIVEALFSL